MIRSARRRSRRWIRIVVVVAACGEPTDRFEVVPTDGGAFTMGDPAGEPDEAPRRMRVGAFRMMRTEVTNAMFERFVEESGHRTDPERSGFGQVWDREWRRVAGADWRRPAGPGSSIGGLDDHPVVQVSARDAAAFCRHYGMRLPTEAEWEFAARGGEDPRRYPWGDDPPEDPAGSRRANYGTNRCCAPGGADGFRRTAPVGAFPAGASPFGALDMSGNVWEWTSTPYPGRPGFVSLRGGGWGNDAYCLRVSYRHANPPDIGLDMVGFRCVSSIDESSAQP